MHFSVKKICISAILVAICYILTTFAVIPMPSGQGFLNFGDAMILLAVIYAGPWWGALVGAGAGALADLTLGATFFIPFTIVAKGGEALLAGYLSKIFKNKTQVVAFIFGALWMLLVYFIGSIIFIENKTVALVNLGFDAIQATVSIILALALLKIIKPSMVIR